MKPRMLSRPSKPHQPLRPFILAYSESPTISMIPPSMMTSEPVGPASATLPTPCSASPGMPSIRLIPLRRLISAWISAARCGSMGSLAPGPLGAVGGA